MVAAPRRCLQSTQNSAEYEPPVGAPTAGHRVPAVRAPGRRPLCGHRHMRDNAGSPGGQSGGKGMDRAQYCPTDTAGPGLCPVDTTPGDARSRDGRPAQDRQLRASRD